MQSAYAIKGGWLLDNLWILSWSFKENSILEIGLLSKSLSETICLTLILLNLLSFSDIFLLIVIIKEFPSIKIFLFNSNVSEKINNSKTLERSENFIIA